MGIFGGHKGSAHSETSTHSASATMDTFDPEEQAAWRASQQKIAEAAKIAQHGALKFQQADEHLTQAERAQRAADEAAYRKMELEREAQAAKLDADAFKSKQPELYDAQRRASELAKEKQYEAKNAQQEVAEAERLAREKEHALHDLKPQMEKQTHRHRSLADKLADHQRMTQQYEEEHARRMAEYEELKRLHEGNMAHVARIEKEHAPINAELLALEEQMHALRERHNHSLHGLNAAKDKANHSHTRLHNYDPSEHDKALSALRGHRQREEELAAELAAAKERAHSLQDAHESYMAEHRRALEHHKHISGGVSPIMQEVEAARLAMEKAERELAEHDARAKHSHRQYRDLMGQANDHGRRAADLEVQAEKHTKGYAALRREGDDAVARKEQLWAEAKDTGDSGMSHFKEKVMGMEARLDHLGGAIKEKLHMGDNSMEGSMEGGHATQGMHTRETSHGGLNAGGSHTTSGMPATHTEHAHAPVSDNLANESSAYDTSATGPAPKKSGLKAFFGK